MTQVILNYAGSGDSLGCFNVGIDYFNGFSVKKNKKTAKSYFGTACDMGNQKGCENYRLLNSTGH